MTLFELPGGGSHEAVDVPVKDGRSIDDILASIMDGKENHQELFETLKSVARDAPDSNDVIAASKPAMDTTKELGEQFLCPVCETLVAADAAVCPGCGAEFSEGASAEYECPVCKSAVPADADQCPNCGVHFAEDEGPATAGKATIEAESALRKLAERPSVPPASQGVVAEASAAANTPRVPLLNRLDQLRQARRHSERRIPSGDRKLLYRELPKLVNEVKPLLASAKLIGLEIDDGKRIINEAIQAGKNRDIERAVSLIADGRRSLDIAFVEFIGGRIETFIEEIRSAKGESGLRVVTANLSDAIGRLEAGDYDGAWDIFQSALVRFESEAKDFHIARKTLEEGERLVHEVKTMGMEVASSERLLRQARESMDRRDIAAALREGKQGRDRLDRDVPAFVQEEMRKARSHLLDLKLKGNDLAKPIGILKEASSSVKQKTWADALRQIREFYKEIKRFG